MENVKRYKHPYLKHVQLAGNAPVFEVTRYNFSTVSEVQVKVAEFTPTGSLAIRCDVQLSLEEAEMFRNWLTEVLAKE